MLDRNELIMEGLAYTVMGIVVVFAVLVIIMLVIKAMALFSGSEENKKENAVETSQPAENAKQEKNDGNIIAAIVAAIAAMLGKSATGFRIRSYRKIQDGEWNKEGRREVLNNKI